MKKDSVIFLGAHPDDLIGSAGTALLMRGIYDLHIWDFTRGEQGLADIGISMEECARTRMEEERKVADMLGAHLRFFNEVDGMAFAGEKTCRQIAEALAEVKPRAVITHSFPDRHVDHCMCTAAFLKAVQLAQIQPEILFFEETSQTLHFHPRKFVDITSVIEGKIALIRLYACQNRDDSLVTNKLQDALFRGSQVLVKYAEAFEEYAVSPVGPSVLDNLAAGIPEKQ